MFFASLVLVGCEDDARIMQGYWDITTIVLENNTCEAAGVDDTSLAVGTPEEVVLLFEGDGGFTLFIGDHEGTANFTIDGESFAGTAEPDRSEFAYPCFLLTNQEIDGRVVSSVDATSTNRFTVTKEGDCALTKPAGVPCGYTTQQTWEFTGSYPGY